MAAKFAELWVEIGAKLDNFNRGMADVDKATQRIGKRLEKVGKKMTMTVTLPLLALGGAAVKMSADFDKGMTESLAIMDNVSPAMRAEMEKTAKQMSEESTFASKELAASYFYLASAGMDAAQSIKALPVVTKFAQAGAFDLATATDLLTDAQTALGLSSKNVEKNQKNLLRVSDVLVKANTLANAKVRQFSESLTNRAAPALRIVGKDIEEGVAVLAAFADQGRKGSEAGEAFSIVLRDLQRAALGNKEAFREAGITVYDAQEEMVNMADIIGDLEKRLGGMSDAAKKSEMTTLGFQERSQANILTLIGMSDKIRTYEKELRKAGGTTETVATKQLQAFSNQMVVLRNELVNVGIQIGDILIPIIKEFVDDHIKPAVKWFSGLSESSKTMTIKIAGIAAATGPLLYIFGKLLVILPKLRMAFALMTGPIGIMIAAATTLGIVLGKVIDSYKAKQDAEMDAMVEAAKGHKEFWAFRKKLIENEIVTVEEWKEIYEKHGRNYKRVMLAMSKLPEYAHIREKLKELKDAQEEAGKPIDELVDKNILLASSLSQIYTNAEGVLAAYHALEEQLDPLGLKTLEVVEDCNELALAWDQFEIESQDTFANVMENMGFFVRESGKLAEEYEESIKGMTEAQQEFAAVALGEFVAMEASLKGFVDAIMKTFEKWAIGQIIPKIMAALPFPANLLATGGAILAIKTLFAGLESLETGGLIPRPMPVMAGHGPKGEIIAQPSKLAEIISREMPKQARPSAPDMRPQKIILPLTVQIGGEKYEKQIVYIVKKKAEVGDLKLPAKVIV